MSFSVSKLFFNLPSLPRSEICLKTYEENYEEKNIYLTKKNYYAEATFQQIFAATNLELMENLRGELWEKGIMLKSVKQHCFK